MEARVRHNNDDAHRRMMASTIIDIPVHKRHRRLRRHLQAGFSRFTSMRSKQSKPSAYDDYIINPPCNDNS